MQTTSGLRAAINHYAQHHRTPANRALHFVGIPTIAIGLLGLLSKLSLDIGTAPALRPNAAWLALLGTGWWYFRSGGLLGLATFAAILLCYAAGSLLPGDALAWLLAAGVAAHLVGHFGFEKKPPTVFSRPLAALAAPAWLLLTLAGREPGE